MATVVAKLGRSSLIGSNLLFLLASLSAGAGNYLYHSLTGRLLAPADYGAVAALISLYYMLLVPSTALTTLTMSLTARSVASGRLDEVHGLLNTLSRYAGLGGASLLLLLFLLAGPVSRFLHIPSRAPVMILGVACVLSVVLPIRRGVLQGMQAFRPLSLNIGLESLLKLSLAVALVLLGFGVSGAIISIVLSQGLAYLFMCAPLRRVRATMARIPSVAQITLCGLPIVFSTLGLVTLQSADVILVRHLLPAEEAGLFSALATTGRLIFFATASLAGVMFPALATLYHSGRPHRALANAFLLASLGVSATMCLMFWLAPQSVVLLLFGEKYLGIVPNLGPFALSMSMLAMSNTLISYFLSVDQTRFMPVLLGIMLLYPASILVLHVSEIRAVVQLGIAANALLLVALVGLYLRPMCPPPALRNPFPRLENERT